MRVLVTGAFGFLGGAVVRELAVAGHEVWALTSQPPGAVRESLPVARMLHGDVRNADVWGAALSGVEGVCHLAALTQVRASFEQPELYRAVNADAVRVLVEQVCRGAVGTPRVVLASTAAVYGAPDRQPMDEDTPLAPTSPYGSSKAAAEQVLRGFAESGRVQATALRCFNIAGPGDHDETRIIPKTLAVAAGRHPVLELNGDGSAVRDFVHLHDAAAAFALALTATTPTPQRSALRTYNVGATLASVAEIVRAVEALTGRTVPVRHNPPKPEPQRLLADTTRIRRDLAWTPTRSSLPDIIADTWSTLPR